MKRREMRITGPFIMIILIVCYEFIGIIIMMKVTGMNFGRTIKSDPQNEVKKKSKIGIN